MAIVEHIVRHIVQTKFEDIPCETVERQKDILLDTLGVAVAGSKAPGVEKVVGFLKKMKGRKESSLIVHGGKLPTPHATMANSLMAHALDFDDMHEAAGVHTNICVVPPALAMAEKVGDVNGKTFLTAMVLGVDLICRMGSTIPLSRGWHATTTFGIFGAAVASSKILGLDEVGMANALGIAYSQASGNRQGRLEGALTKRLQPALAAKAGVLSSLLAYEGVTGPREIFEGDWGMLGLYTDPHQSERADEILANMMLGWGERFLGDELSIKPYPSCKATHTSIEAALHLKRENKIESCDIEKVDVYVSDGCYQTVGHPFVIRRDAQVDAQFSIPYTVATALMSGKVGLDDFTEAAIKDADRTSLTEKVKVHVDPDLHDTSKNVVNLESRVVIKAQGKSYSLRCEMSRGHPELPMNREDIVSKFQDCFRFAAVFSPETANALLRAISNLEELEDVGQIATFLRSD